MPKEDLNELLSWATAREREYIEAIQATGSLMRAAEKLGVTRGTVQGGLRYLRKRAARQGYSPAHDMTKTVPDGYKVKGVSTYYDKDGKAAGQWVKSSIDEERQETIRRAAMEAFAQTLPRVKPRKAAGDPAAYSARLMACYPIGDAHIGMMAWPEETGEAWDLKIAEEMHTSAMAALVEMAPACEEAVIVNLGDWYHADNMEGVTSRSGHKLDMDSRYAKMARTGVRIMRTMVETALSKHKRVRVINAVGNHDDTGSLMLSICLANIYEHEPRVIVDTNPTPCHYIRHGATFVGVHHGHSIKPERLPGVMATDRPKDWGETTHRYWWMGHVHHQSVMKDHPGVSVESFRTLAAKDAYATWGGYRAPRDMKVILLHDQHGEVGRYTVTPEMLAEV